MEFTEKELETEYWKDLPDYEGKYQISNLGRVKSLLFNKERILKRCSNSGGYYVVGILGMIKTVHSLVALCFLDFKSCGRGLVVDHIDEVKTNNRCTNLQILSFRANISKSRVSSSSFTGVHWSNSLSKWVASIQIEGFNYKLGVYTDVNEAKLIYDKVLDNWLTLEVKPGKDEYKFLNKVSKYKGVMYKKSTCKWISQIFIKGESFGLGSYNSEYEAHLAYEKASSDYKLSGILPIKNKKSSKYKGISYNIKSKMWVAYTYIDGKHVHIGSFKDENLAYVALCEFKNNEKI